MARLGIVVVLIAALPGAIGAQQVPGRDLLDFQVGTIGEAPALAHLSGDGLWNPAAVAVPGGFLARFSASTLHAPSEQAVSAASLSASVRIRPTTTVSLGVVRAAVSDLLRTDTDPQTIGGEVPYSTTVVSATVARRHGQFVLGLAARYRHGRLDDIQRGVVGLDAGAIAEDLLHGRVRVAAATFLWRPGGADGIRQLSYNLAGDVRIAGPDSLREARGGYALLIGENDVTEHFGYVAGRYGPVEGRAGMARFDAFGHTDWRMRLGLSLHYARYTVGIAREENGAGLAPVYQFTLSATIQ
ncbi:MAG TPA: hypothetical protein VMM18_11950 [Gemmatimonadaceae bacterium]|nr:hypothetical protein [Gemmatimonadaceae bacterium]